VKEIFGNRSTNSFFFLQKLLLPRASHQNSDTAFGLSEPDFPYATDILAIGRHLPTFWWVFSLVFLSYIIYLTFNVAKINK